MSWSDGVTLAEDVWETVRPYIPEKERKEVARTLLHRFENEDANDWNYGCLLYRDAEIEEEEN